MSRISRLLFVSGCLPACLFPLIHGASLKAVHVTGSSFQADGEGSAGIEGSAGLVTGSCSWLEPVIGTDESSQGAADGITLSNLSFPRPPTGWSENPWPIRKVLFPKEAEFAYVDLAGQAYAFGAALIGGNASVRLSYAGQSDEGPTLASLNISPVDESLFDERLLLEIDGLTALSLIPFPVPRITVSPGTGSGLVLGFTDGEPSTTWDVRQSDTLGSGSWLSEGIEVILNENGDASVEVPFPSSPLFIKASLVAP